jgi:hypothetical protein
MKKKIALVFRGKCLDDNLNCKTNRLESIDYKLYIDNVKKYIINVNKKYDFDIYLHGWIRSERDIPDILNAYKPKKYILEKQIDFEKDYIHLENYQEILQERYSHLHKNKNIDTYNSIYYNNYFQNICSYAYSISKSMELVSSNINYKYIISLRYDGMITDYVRFKLYDNTKYYTDRTGISHSHLFHGDFICMSNQNTMMKLKLFYKFLNNNIYNNNIYNNWVINIRQNKNLTGRYNHGIYSNQMIYAYFLSKINIKYNNIISILPCRLIKVYI